MNQIKPGRYRHYKGNEYTVFGTAQHSETLEELVLYRQEYGILFSGTIKVMYKTVHVIIVVMSMLALFSKVFRETFI